MVDSQLWWIGPEWLQHLSSHWPKQPQVLDQPPERIASKCASTNEVNVSGSPSTSLVTTVSSPKIFSDNSTNFIGAKNDVLKLQKLFNEDKPDTVVHALKDKITVGVMSPPFCWTVGIRREANIKTPP